MASGKTLPRGRMTIRKSGGKRVRLFELNAEPGTTAARLEAVYLSSLEAVDRTEAHHNASKAESRTHSRWCAR